MTPLARQRTGSWTWEIVESFASVMLTVQHELDDVTIRGVEHDLSAMVALLERDIKGAAQQALYDVTATSWTFGLCCNGHVTADVEREIRRRLKSLGSLIDPDSNEKIRPDKTYLP